MDSILRINKIIAGNKPDFFRFYKLGVPIILIVLLVVSVNWLNQRHLEQVQNDLDALYIERLVSQDYLYNLNDQFNLKRYQIATGEVLLTRINGNPLIEQYMSDMKDSRLSPEETLYFHHIKKNYEKLILMESSAISLDNKSREDLIGEMNRVLDKIMLDIDSLLSSKLSDNTKLLEVNKSVLQTKSTLLSAEIGFLIVLGVICQIIIYYSLSTNKQFS